MNKKLLIVLCSLMSTLCVCSCAMVAPVPYSRSISPVKMGLLQAKTGEERYLILLNAHKEAVEKGVVVDYRGLKSIDLTIPQNAASIPLGAVNDFAGVVFNVTNKTKDMYLFSYVNRSESISVTSRAIDEGSFIGVAKLQSGKKLLSIEDKNPWVANRKSYSYGHQRKDILLLENGRAKNSPVMPYNNAQSDPVSKYYSVKYPYLQVSSVTLNRSSASTAKTHLCRINGTNDVRLKNVRINTPQSDLTRDEAIRIQDCTNVSFENVTINGTYSRKDFSGYGISMNNVWNFRAKRLFGHGNWGIFGNNNINTVLIEDSEINRFDIHCYGRDVSFINVTFVDLYNQFSSAFGIIRFDKCTFKGFTPVLYEASYNAYAPHELVFNDCVFHLTAKRNYLISAGRLTPEENTRVELRDKCWPNVTINRMKVIVDEEVNAFNVFKVAIDPGFDGLVSAIESITINGLEFEYGSVAKVIPINISSRDVATVRPLHVSVNKLKAGPGTTLNLRVNKGDNRIKVTLKRSSIGKVLND